MKSRHSTSSEYQELNGLLKIACLLTIYCEHVALKDFLATCAHYTSCQKKIIYTHSTKAVFKIYCLYALRAVGLAGQKPRVRCGED
jgi:hypothetical protein